MTDAENPELLRSEASSQRATFLELFFDLVFVFALNRISQRLIIDFTSGRQILLGEAYETLVLFLAIWLLWSFTALTTSRLDPNHPALQLVVVTSMLGALVMAVAVPRAFGERAVLFALALLVPALLHVPPLAVSGAAAAVLAGVAGSDALRSRGRGPELPTPPI